MLFFSSNDNRNYTCPCTVSVKNCFLASYCSDFIVDCKGINISCTSRYILGVLIDVTFVLHQCCCNNSENRYRTMTSQVKADVEPMLNDKLKNLICIKNQLKNLDKYNLLYSPSLKTLIHKSPNKPTLQLCFVCVYYLTFVAEV